MPQPPPPIPILLLKTKSSPHDGYDDYFSANNYAPSFIPVLEHRFHAENLARVRDLFAAGAFEPTAEHAETAEQTAEVDPSLAAGAVSGRRYGGMIFTSQRAVEAFASMLEGGGGGGAVPNASNTPNATATANGNMNLNIPLYTVGPATARSLTSLRDKYLPAATIHGVDAGNGENLAHQILEHYNAIYPPPPSSSESQSQSQSQIQKPALLFLVGEQRRDIIPKTLMAPTLAETERIPVDELVVYGTAEMGSFEADFETALRRCLTTDEDEDANGKGEGGGDGPVWVVVFSPSGCEGMLRVLGLGPFSSSSSSTSASSGISGMMMDHGGKRRVFVATIGPTTRDYLRERFGFETDVCAERPSPEGVGEGILRFMRTVGIE